jgi:Transposase and inactivated derivatives
MNQPWCSLFGGLTFWGLRGRKSPSVRWGMGSPLTETFRCGYVKKDLTLADRVFVCPKCGWVADRDYNASLNILRAGSGLPLESVDREPLLYIPFSKGVYSKFRGRSRKSSPRGGDAPSVRAG